MNFNVVASLTRQVGTRPAHTAIVFESIHWSYEDLDEAVSATSVVLRDAGVKRGDRVAILGLNSDEYVISQLAVGRLGAIAVLLNYRLTAEELKYLLCDSEPVALLLDEEFIQMREELVESTRSILFCALVYTETNIKDGLAHLRKPHLGVDVVDAHMDADDLDRILHLRNDIASQGGDALSRKCLVEHPYDDAGGVLFV